MFPFIETIRIEGGMIHNLLYHNTRMNQTRKEVFGLETSLDLATFIQPDTFQERTKCRVEYAGEILGITYGPYQMRPVRSLRLVVSDTVDYRYKSTDRTLLNDLFEQREGCDDILIVRNGLLTDTSICNIALWDGRSWITPASPLLCGTMRAYLLDKGCIFPENIPATDIRKYPRIRLFNAMIGFGELEIRTEYLLPYC